LLALFRLAGVKRTLIGDGHALVPLRGLGLETLHHFVGAAVAWLLWLALVAGKCKGGRPDEGGRCKDGNVCAQD
jgi:hypothetical protein